MAKETKVIGINWHWLDLAINNWQNEEIKIKNDVGEIGKYLSNLDGDEIFAIETSNDHLFETLAMEKGFTVYWIHTTKSRRCIEEVLLEDYQIDETELKKMKKNDVDKAHKLSAYAIRKTFQESPGLFIERPPVDHVIVELQEMARDRLYIQDNLNSMAEHTKAVVKKLENRGVKKTEKFLERERISNEFYEGQKKEIDKEFKRFFEDHKDHPVIKAIAIDLFGRYRYVPKLSVALIIGETYDIRRFLNKDAYVGYCRMYDLYSREGKKKEYDKDEFLKHKVQRDGRLKRAYTDLTGVGQNMSTGMLKKVNPDLWDYYQDLKGKYENTEYSKHPVNRARKTVASWICKQVYKRWRDAVR